MYSIVMNGFPSIDPASRMPTIAGWESLDAARASRSKRAISSSFAPSPARRTFIATTSPFCLSFAR